MLLNTRQIGDAGDNKGYKTTLYPPPPSFGDPETVEAMQPLLIPPRFGDHRDGRRCVAISNFLFSEPQEACGHFKFLPTLRTPTSPKAARFM